MLTILWLLMGFAGALPAVLAGGALLYCRAQRRDIRQKLELSQAPQGLAGESYLRGRVDPAIEGYHNGAAACAACHTCLTVLQITWSAMIAAVLLITEQPGEPGYTKVFSAVLSAAVAAASGVNAACKFRERWLQYLALRDKLFAERSVFMSGQIYEGLWRGGKNGARRNFVETCERIIALEYLSLAEHPGRHEGEVGVSDRAEEEEIV